MNRDRSRRSHSASKSVRQSGSLRQRQRAGWLRVRCRHIRRLRARGKNWRGRYRRNRLRSRLRCIRRRNYWSNRRGGLCSCRSWLNARSHVRWCRRCHLGRNRSLRDWRNRCRGSRRCRRNWRVGRYRPLAREAHPPKSSNCFRKLKLHVSANIPIILRFHHLANDFLLRLVVRQKKQLPCGHRRAQPNHRAVVHHQHRLRRLRKRLAFVAAFHRPRTVHRYGHFQRHWLGLARFFRARCSSGSRLGIAGFEVFRSWRHQSAHLGVLNLCRASGIWRNRPGDEAAWGR